MSRLVNLSELGLDLHNFGRLTIGDLATAHASLNLSLDDVLVCYTGYVFFSKLLSAARHENLYAHFAHRVTGCLAVPLELTRRYTNAIAHFQNLHDHVRTNTTVAFPAFAIELLSNDRGLVELFGDNLDYRCFAYELTYGSHRVIEPCVICMMAGRGNDSKIYIEPNATGFAYLHDKIRERLTVMYEIVVVLSDDVSKEIDREFGATSYIKYSQFASQRHLRRLVNGKRGASLKINANQRMSVGRTICRDKLPNFVEKVTRLVPADKLGGIYIGRPDRCEIWDGGPFNAPAGGWLDHAIVRRPYQHNVVVGLCLALSSVMAPFELLEVAVLLPGMSFFHVRDLRDLLISIYKSIRVINKRKDGPSRSTRSAVLRIKH